MSKRAFLSSSLSLVLALLFVCATSAQMAPPPAPMYATNTAGFIQYGPNGANNLVQFTVPFLPEPKPGGELPDPLPLIQFDFTVIAELSTGVDANNDGVNDTLGNFSGLEWSSGVPGSGSLIGCTLNDDDANGEIYRIVPETGETELLGQAPGGLVREVAVEAGGTGYFSSPFAFPTSGGSGQNLSVVITANGAVTSATVANCGSGYQVNDVVTIETGDFNATLRITEVIEQTGFVDLAYNPVQGRMWGILNDVVDDGGQVVIQPNIMWFDSDGDLIPDRKAGFIQTGPCNGTQFLATLANGIAFDQNGAFYVFDTLENEIFVGFSTGCIFPLDAVPTPFGPMDFGDLETNITNSTNELGTGLTVVNGDDLIIATDAPNNETFISTFYLPDLGGGPPDPTQIVFDMGEFEQEFFQNDFFAEVRVGDLVGAQTDFDNSPQTFPDNVTILAGAPGKNALLEFLALSDDLRFCVYAEPPAQQGDPLMSLEFVYTIPNPTDLTALGVDVELQANVSNLGQFVSAFNVNTQQYDVISFDPDLPIGVDETRTFDLTFLGIDNYVDPNTGTMKIKIDTIALGLVQSFPWQVKYDSVLALFEF